MYHKTVDIFDLIEDNGVQLRTRKTVSVERVCRLTMEKIAVEKPGLRKNHRVIRLVILAAVITSLLMGTTVFACVSFARYEDPLALLQDFFGNSTFEGGEGGQIVIEYPGDKEVAVTQPTVERIPVEETVAQEKVAPYIMEVNQAVSQEGSTLTVLAHQYDSAIGSGIIYYTLENPEGVSGYAVQPDKELWWPEGTPIRCSVWGKEYVIERESTGTKLAVALYYQLPLSFAETSISIGFSEKNRLLLEMNDGGGMESVASADGNILISPTGMKMCLDDMEFLGVIDTDGTYIPPRDGNRITYLSLVFYDGTEFVVVQDRDGKAVVNYSQASVISCFPTYITYTFNRIITVDSVEAVTVNDVRYPVNTPEEKGGAGKKAEGAVRIDGDLTFEEASTSKEEEAKGNDGGIDEGKLKHRILGARVVTNAEDIPSGGGFFDYCGEAVYTSKGEQLYYRYPEFIREDGSFVDGVRLLLVDVEITSMGAENWTVGTWPPGLYEDPYVFRIDGMYWLREKRAWNGERCREWAPDYFSDMYSEPEHPFAYRLHPGQTRQFTVGFLIGGYMDGTVIPVEALCIRVPYGYGANEAEQHGKEQLFPIG